MCVMMLLLKIKLCKGSASAEIGAAFPFPAAFLSKGERWLLAFRMSCASYSGYQDDMRERIADYIRLLN